MCTDTFIGYDEIILPPGDNQNTTMDDWSDQQCDIT